MSYEMMKGITIPTIVKRSPVFCGNVLDLPERIVMRVDSAIGPELLALPKYKYMPTEDLAARAQVHLRRKHAEKLFANQVEHPDRALAIAILEGIR